MCLFQIDRTKVPIEQDRSWFARVQGNKKTPEGVSLLLRESGTGGTQVSAVGILRTGSLVMQVLDQNKLATIVAVFPLTFFVYDSRHFQSPSKGGCIVQGTGAE